MGVTSSHSTPKAEQQTAADEVEGASMDADARPSGPRLNFDPAKGLEETRPDEDAFACVSAWDGTECSDTPCASESCRRQVESLFEAAATGNAAKIQLLCEHGHQPSQSSKARQNLQGRDGVHPGVRGLYSRTALHVAADAGHADCVALLLGVGASVDAPTDSGFTACHLACQRGHVEVVWLLLQSSCDLTAQADQGETPLHLAAAHGRSEVVACLLEHGPHGPHGPHVGIRNNFGQLPHEVCQDAATLQCFRRGMAALFSGKNCTDSYAGRTILEFAEGSVLLRNCRHDAIRRLIHASDSDPVVPPTGPSQRTRQRSERSFLKLQEREPDEVVGPESFRVLSLLGKGSFGEVFQAAHKVTGQVFAMKVLRKRKILNRNLMRYALTERNLLSYMRHPFIVRLYHAFQTPSCLVLVLQYCPGGNLSMLLQREGALPEAVARLYASEVLLALEHLHERRVVYRDLKPENVVLDDEAHAVLTDFGLSKEGVDRCGGTKSFCGSVAYLAPEILTRSGHGRTVDLYGLGVLLFEMMEGQPPYYSRDRDTLFRNIVTATLQAPARCSSVCADLIRVLMHRDPAKRIGKRHTPEVRSHPFFAGIDFDQVLKREVSVPPLRHWSTSFSMLRTDEKVASPFEGRFGCKVFQSWSSSAQEIRGWDFSLVDETHCGAVAASRDSTRSLVNVEGEAASSKIRSWKRRSRRNSTPLGTLRRATTTFRALLSV